MGCTKLSKREQSSDKSFENVNCECACDFVNVLELNDNFLPQIGGTQVHMYSLCRCLVAKGHKPVVLAWEPSKPSFEVMDEMVVHRFWMPFLFQVLRYPAILYLSLRILSLMRRYKIEIIHAHDYFCGLASVLAGRLLGKPVVVTFHIPMWFWPNLELPVYVSPIEPLLKKYFINSVAGIICNSESTRQETLKLGFPGSKLKVIHNWLVQFSKDEITQSTDALPKFNLDKRDFILSVGRLEDKHKGFSILISALELLTKRGYDLDLAIVGEGPDREMLRMHSLKLGIKDRVHLLGSVSNSELTSLYEKCVLFVLPSVIEPFGLVLLEAMSFGKPIVATRVGGIPEVIENGENGLLVEPTPKALASGIEMILSTPHIGEAFTKRSPEVVSEKFSIRNCYATIDFLEGASKAETQEMKM